MPDYVDDTANLKELTVKRTFNSNLPTTQFQIPHQVHLNSNAKLGAWAHAVEAKLNLQTSGSVHGVGSGATSVLIPPNGSLQRGALYAHIFEVGCQASSTWGSAGPVAFLKFDQWGTKPHFDANAFFFDVQGLAEGTSNMFSAGTADKTVKGTLKIRIGTTTYYVMLTDSATS